MEARDVKISVPGPFVPEIDLEDLPARFQGAAAAEITIARFRCPHCGIPCQAAILPQSPQVAKFRCRRCDNTIDLVTRPSAMDNIEEECELRKDIGHVENHPKEFSKNLARACEAALVFAKLR